MRELQSIERVQALRSLTRAVSDLLREQITTDLATLAVLFRPRGVLGQHIQGFEKDVVKGADRVFRDLQTLFATVAKAPPFGLARPDLKSPLDVVSFNLELSPVEYAYPLTIEGQPRMITMRRPLSWMLSYAGYGIDKLPELLARRTGASEELHQWLLHQLMLHVVVANQPGLTDILARLHFTIAAVKEDASGLVPQTRVASPVSTVRPPDDVLVKAVELTGMDAFEEVSDVADIATLADPLKDRLAALAASHGTVV